MPNLEEELMMEKWCLLKKDKEDLPPFPICPLIIKLEPSKFLEHGILSHAHL